MAAAMQAFIGGKPATIGRIIQAFPDLDETQVDVIEFLVKNLPKIERKNLHNLKNCIRGFVQSAPVAAEPPKQPKQTKQSAAEPPKPPKQPAAEAPKPKPTKPKEDRKVHFGGDDDGQHFAAMDPLYPPATLNPRWNDAYVAQPVQKVAQNIQLCHHGRFCNKKATCQFRHNGGKGFSMCKFGTKCKRPDCFFCHTQYDYVAVYLHEHPAMMAKATKLFNEHPRNAQTLFDLASSCNALEDGDGYEVFNSTLSAILKKK